MGRYFMMQSFEVEDKELDSSTAEDAHLMVAMACVSVCNEFQANRMALAVLYRMEQKGKRQ